MPKPKRRKMLANGRNGCDRFVALPHYLLKSPAWMTMTPNAKALLIQLWARHNGTNNGEIGYSVRDAVAIGLSKDQAARALKELVERGFLRVGRESSFTLKSKAARTWILTGEPIGAAPATKEFMRWQQTTEVEKNISRSHQCDTQSHQCDSQSTNETKLPITVSPVRPSEIVDTISRSHQCDTYIIPCSGEEALVSGRVLDGASIKAERLRRKLSLRALASLAGISHEAVAKIERGELRGPAIAKLSAALNSHMETEHVQ
ncbi:hypothetical protein H261_19199 [Paramagnetospirillum caucaseum]|uniref:HTH cro/C1-type domain-containing protein n=1 Tax=Paramagnetospirillum caucaseum TaxID=1244869 RepID=M3A644_9PROT|nr:helix-turn-helix domain-containing protein [Paramagnetospirillum caucaseum]EME68268.1 hypothetical protein H261_19199 [Paramagnetospirillum caucaseum]